MAKFCGKCGAKLDEKTGLCPNCNADELKKLQELQSTVSKGCNTIDQPTSIDVPFSNKEVKKQKKVQKKAEKKAKWVSMTIGQKIRNFFSKLIVLLLVLMLLTVGIVVALVYFNLLDIPLMSAILEEIGMVSAPPFVTQTVDGCYIPEEDNIVYENASQSFGYVNNMVLVFIYEGVSDERIAELVEGIDGQIVGEISGINQYQIQVKAQEKEKLESICASLMETDEVKLAIIDNVVTMQSSSVQPPNDPWKDTFQGIWGVDWDEENPSGHNWWIEAAKVLSAWSQDNYFTTINVGIVDNGFDTNHEDLNITLLNSEVNNAENHGTHVAGIIGATINNGMGISGIVNHVNLYAVDCYATSQQKKNNVTVSSLMAGINSCIKNKCKVVNMSSAVAFTSTEETKDNSRNTARIATIYLLEMLDSYDDFIIVQSAGNGNKAEIGVDASQYAGYFAAISESTIQAVFEEYEEYNIELSREISVQEVLDSFMVVGAVDKNQKKNSWQLADFSNYGDSITVCAPGVKVFSTLVSGGLDGAYGYLGGNGSGTSMAAPIVAGVTAMVWSVNQSLSAGKVKQIITSSATETVLSRNKNDNGIYYIVNANAAVALAVDYVSAEQPIVHGGQFDQTSVPDDAGEFNGHYYYVYDIDTIKDWNEAQEYCEAQGGYLATITSVDEDSFLYSYIVSRGYYSAMFGLTDQDTMNVWTWTTGEAFIYENWHSGEPNHQGGYEHYGMYYSRNTDGSWNDGSGQGGPFICEWGEYEINRTLPESTRTTSDERDVVLVLDVSGSMSGAPMEKTKKAATNFVNTILGEDASIGIVTYDDTARVAADFLIQADPLVDVISRISSGGNTNIEDSLSTAYDMLQISKASLTMV